jgi:hypothetical protein
MSSRKNHMKNMRLGQITDICKMVFTKIFINSIIDDKLFLNLS